MEIRIDERLTGRQVRDRILAQHGSREALERRARNRKDAQAWSDLQDLRLLDEDPRRLEEDLEVTTIAILTPEDLARLTPERLRLLDHLAEADRPLNVTALAAALKRDKKNVSEDLGVLLDLGLVAMEVRGREKVPRALGREIRIVLGGP